MGIGTYTVSETETNRYKTEKVEADFGTVVGNTAEFTVNDAEKDYKATFTNKKKTQEGLSHTSQISNILKRSRKLTAIVAEWNGPETIGSGQLNKDNLTVTAVYDDGVQETISNKSTLQLSPDSFDNEMSGGYTIKVSYTEDTITRSDSFVVNISGASPFTWRLKDGSVPCIVDGIKCEGEVIINGYTGKSSTLRIPKILTTSEGKKYKVVGVAGSNGGAMYGVQTPNSGGQQVDTLILPDGLETIAEKTFRDCTNLSGDLIIPDSVTSIGDYAFNGCTGFTGELTLGNSVKTIGECAFSAAEKGWWKYMNFAGPLTFPDSVETVGEYAFFGCNKMTGRLDISSSMKEIGSWAFFGCEKLQGSLDLTNVTSLGNRVFANCNALDGELKLPTSSSVSAIKMNTFYECNNLSGTLEIPANIKKISYGAFYNCQGFSKLILHEGLEEISVSTESGENFEKYGAFQSCTGLTSNITIPNTVTKIGTWAFRDCSNLTGMLEIPASTKKIGYGAFYNCEKFTSLKLNNGLEEIGVPLTDAENTKCEEWNRGVFWSCKGFTGNLTIPDTVTVIGDRAFQYCTGFKGSTLTIPKNNSLREIGKYAFYHCFFDYEWGKSLNEIKSIVWIPIDANDISDYELEKIYLIAPKEITDACKLSSKLTVGEDPFYGYQLPYAFFERNS